MTAFSAEELAAAEQQIEADRAAIARGVTPAKIVELTRLLSTREIPRLDRLAVAAALELGAMTEELTDEWLDEFRALPTKETT